MWESIFIWSLVLIHMRLASSLSLPFSVSVADPLPGPKVNISALPIATVPDIPDLNIRLQFNRNDQPLDQPSVYATTVELMYQLAQQPWSEIVKLHNIFPMVKIGYKAVILARLSGSGKLETRHAILTLHKAITAMASGQPGYYQFSALINFQGHLVGSIQMNRLGDAPGLVGGIASSSARLGNTTVSARTNEIIDPKDPSTLVRFTMGRQTLPSQEVLTAVLDGLVEVAQHAGGTMKFITGQSASGGTELYFSGMLGQDLLAKDVSRALYLVSLEFMIPFLMYRETLFDLYKSGVWIASGRIGASRVETNRGDVVASS